VTGPGESTERSSWDDLVLEIEGMGTEVTPEGVAQALNRHQPPRGRLDQQILRERLMILLRGHLTAPAAVVQAWFDQGDEEFERSAEEGTGSASSDSLIRPDPEPWDEPVEGSSILAEVEAIVSRFIIMPKPALVTVALWVLLTWTHNAFDTSPLLAILSPTKRCGKTKLLRVLNLLCSKAVPASNITPAALFRTVEAHQPTLLIDEGDSFLDPSEELRGILNSGHTKDTAAVIRTVGLDHEPRVFATWCPKAIARNGTLASTLMDRSVVLKMRRKLVSERVSRFRAAGLDEEVDRLRRRLCRWARDYSAVLAVVEPEPIHGLNDRAIDNWEPLLAIAELCSGESLEEARNAALALSDIEDEELGILLLTDLREIFEQNGNPKFLSTEAILIELHAKDESPWSELNRGRGLTARKLAALLRDFEIKPGSNGTVRGYRLQDAEETLARYLGPGDPSTRQRAQESVRDPWEAEHGLDREYPLDQGWSPQADTLTDVMAEYEGFIETARAAGWPRIELSDLIVGPGEPEWYQFLCQATMDDVRSAKAALRPGARHEPTPGA
jgi:Protein of unknown function (DUF3631)